MSNKNRQPTSGPLGEHEIARYMTAFTAALARMDEDPAESARIEALADETDKQLREPISGGIGFGADNSDFGGPASRLRDTLRAMRDSGGDWGSSGRGWLRSIGNLLILACGADYRRMRASTDRQRYITMGALMLLTTALAFYCGISVTAMTLTRPFSHVFWFGLFLAASVFYIDRSIVSYIAPRRPGDDRSKKPRHSRWAIGMRILIATAASILLSEVLMLQIFGPRISVQLASDNLTALRSAATQIDAAYGQQVSRLQFQIDAAQKIVAARQKDANSAYRNMNCQEFGCSGIAAGIGAGFRNAQHAFQAAEAQLEDAQNSLQQVNRANQPEITRLNVEWEQALHASARVTSASQDMLAREQAFWALTVRYPEMAIARVLLMLLLLGIDLAPVVVKITGSYGAYEEEVRSEMLQQLARTEAYAEYMEAKIRIDSQVELARQELDRDIRLLALGQQRRQHQETDSDPPALGPTRRIQ